MSLYPSLSASLSRVLQIPSSSKSAGVDVPLRGSAPQSISVRSDQPSSSSSVSAMSPTPSPSESSHSLGSEGNASELSPTPSPSESSHSLGSRGKHQYRPRTHHYHRQGPNNHKSNHCQSHREFWGERIILITTLF